MPIVEQSIHVNVDATTAYDQWTRFDSLPPWTEGIASVSELSLNRYDDVSTFPFLCPWSTWW